MLVCYASCCWIRRSLFCLELHADFFWSNLCLIIYPNSVTGMDFLWGGNPKDHAAAQEDSWKRMQEFLKAHLSWYLNRCCCHQDSQLGAFFCCTSQLQYIYFTTARMCTSSDSCLHSWVKRCVKCHIPNLNTPIVGAKTVLSCLKDCCWWH